MLPAFPLLLAAYLPGRIKTATKHPMLAAVKLWAFAHLLANGNLADVILFGSFLAWAVADRISLKGRTPPPSPRGTAGQGQRRHRGDWGPDPLRSLHRHPARLALRGLAAGRPLTDTQDPPCGN